MLQTFEASLEPNGQLHFLDAATPTTAARRRVLVTFLPDADTAASGNEALSAGDWRAFVGALSDSPRFADDALAIMEVTKWSRRDEHR
jgi:hypothetical protein